MRLSKCRGYRDVQLLVAAIVISRVIGDDNVGDRLFKEVWKDYQHDVRPLCGVNQETLHATLGIAIRQLIELNEPEQKVSTSIWFRMTWNDCRLRWNPSLYGNITSVTIPKQRMWVPDLTLYDNAQSKLGEQNEYFVSVKYDGVITYNLPAVVKSMCKLDVTMFPFDYQMCFLTLGSWTYNQHQLNFTARLKNPADLSSYIEHGEWDLYKLDVENYAFVEENGVPYGQVKFTVYLRRKPLFHTMNLILPSIIVNSLAIIGFVLPPESGEKLNLEITVLLSLLVFQLVILNSMPHSSKHMPLIAIYFLLSMILIALSCVCTVVILNIHFNKHHTPLPAWIRDILTGRMGRLFRLDNIMLQTHEKRQRLLTEYNEFRPKKPPPSNTYPASSPKKSSKRSSAAQSNGQIFDKLNNLSLRSRKPKDTDDDSVYGFYPNARYGFSTELNALPKQYSAPSKAGAVPATTSFFTVNMSEIRRSESEPGDDDSPNVAVNRKILARMERTTARGIKKQINDLLDTEWKVFAVFLDRLFLFTFLLMGIIVGIGLFSYISS
ncbi:neuronal acetylcholine receptor subunit alpha-3 [Plakobranchus ocellatus]|uniref:Neuronal acetylcholine receptor subunit alpha-3 n=1 Tax=Plakobranchus ocellatus TaxID=259542 RepID=A0AAV4CQQ5_9GAST|nr:neuronal acetylcholine receptor subunit alpha-3 [Plakobranchus ocellatus]